MCARVLLTVSLTLTMYVSAMAEEKAKLNAPPKGFTALFNVSTRATTDGSIGDSTTPRMVIARIIDIGTAADLYIRALW